MQDLTIAWVMANFACISWLSELLLRSLQRGGYSTRKICLKNFEKLLRSNYCRQKGSKVVDTLKSWYALLKLILKVVNFNCSFGPYVTSPFFCLNVDSNTGRHLFHQDHWTFSSLMLPLALVQEMPWKHKSEYPMIWLHFFMFLMTCALIFIGFANILQSTHLIWKMKRKMTFLSFYWLKSDGESSH